MNPIVTAVVTVGGNARKSSTLECPSHSCVGIGGPSNCYPTDQLMRQDSEWFFRRPRRAPAASSAAQDRCIRRRLQKSAGGRTATPSRGGDSGRRSVGRSSSERRGDVVLAQPQRRGAQQAAIVAPSRPGSAEQQSAFPTPRCCSRPKLSGAPALNRATRATIALSVVVGKTTQNPGASIGRWDNSCSDHRYRRMNGRGTPEWMIFGRFLPPSLQQ